MNGNVGLYGSLITVLAATILAFCLFLLQVGAAPLVCLFFAAGLFLTLLSLAPSGVADTALHRFAAVLAGSAAILLLLAFANLGLHLNFLPAGVSYTLLLPAFSMLPLTAGLTGLLMKNSSGRPRLYAVLVGFVFFLLETAYSVGIVCSGRDYRTLYILMFCWCLFQLPACVQFLHYYA